MSEKDTRTQTGRGNGMNDILGEQIEGISPLKSGHPFQ